AVHNLGGISNVTVVTRELDNVRAFDTGPANSLMDAATRRYFKRPYDRGGAKARAGRPDKEFLRRLLAHPYLKKKPPKSTGLETFGAAFLSEVLPPRSRKRGEDVLATLAQFTAHSVADAYRRFVLPSSGITEAVFSGGGTRNTYLMQLLGEHLLPLKLSLSDSYGVPVQAKEAMAFAVLGAGALEGVQTNLPKVTGAGRRVRLGSITMP
ncbi:MAG: anhydro-N-acetylmuramic acid kinase, partial [Thermodesulfovibrionales bacterium]|nr:anhydro-N-acetylmuramic acid kinase [Thermodesulfovibrionales bacterium]